MIKEQSYKDIILIVVLLILSYYAVYIAPDIVRPIIFTGIIIAFIKSKDNAPWLVFFFLLMSSPANLFYRKDSWFLLLGSSTGIPFSILVAISFLIKGMKTRKKIRNPFNIERNTYFFYILVLFAIGFFYGGLSMKYWFILIAWILPNFLLILYLPVIIDMKRDSDRIKKLLFIFTIFLFGIQIYEIIMNQPLFKASTRFLFAKDEGLQRNITGTYFVFLTFLLSTSEFLSKRYKASPLAIVASISSILIFINTGTRGWMLTVFFILIGLFIYGSKPKITSIGLLTIGLYIVISFFVSERYTEKYTSNIKTSFERLSTVLLVVEGDATAGGTLSRLTERGPRVMSEFEKNPIFGLGFSDRMFDYYDGHVGNQSILMQSGLVGFVILYLLVFRILWKLAKRYNGLRKDSIEKFRILTLLIGVFGLIIIHFSSQQMFAYMINGDKILFYAFWFVFISYYFNKIEVYEKK